MKYVRTKDGIYERNKVRVTLNLGIVSSKHPEPVEEIETKISYDTYHYEPIISQADIIEELIDGYYLDIDNHAFDSTQVYDKDDLQRALKEKADWQSYSDRKGLEYEINLYAFIKTDTGLIFKAKLDDKEDLKLL